MMTGTAADNRQTAIRLASAGLFVFPCQSGGDRAKQPMPFLKWRDVSTTDTRQVEQWWQKWPEAAIGIDLGKSGLIVIDCDRHGEHDGVEAFGHVMADNGFNPDSCPLVATPNEGNHLFFRNTSGLGNGRGTLPSGVDVRGDGGYVLAPGTIMQDGRAYELFGDIAAAPDIPDWLKTILKSSRQLETPSRVSAQQTLLQRDTTADELSELLSYISPDSHYDDWVQTLMALHAETGGSATGLSLADDWSSRGSKYKGRREIEAKWRSFRRDGVTRSTLAHLARVNGADLAAIARKYGKVETDYHVTDADHQAARQILLSARGEAFDADTGEAIEPDRAIAHVPANTDFPPGLVGEIAKWIVATARRPQKRLAIGAALTLVGCAAGRHIAGPTDAGTALYVLGLSPTASGKDHPLKSIGRIMTASRLGHHLGPSEFISMTAVINVLKRKPLCLAPMDEFGDFMRRVYARKGSPHERAIPKILRTMWSANFGQGTTPEWAGIQSETIEAPHLSLFGVSTHEQFYSALEGGAASDGTLNRFLIIDEPLRARDRDPDLDGNIVPDRIINDMQLVFMRSGDLASAYRNDASVNPATNGKLTRISWCPDGSHEAWKAWASEIDNRMFDEPDKADFLARGAEMSIRIATILAVGRMADSVEIQDIRYGIQMARDSIEMMIAGASDYMAENEHQANAQKIVRKLKEQGGIIKHKDLLRSMYHMRARDLRDMLAMMVDAGQLERVDIKPDRGPPANGYRLLN